MEEVVWWMTNTIFTWMLWITLDNSGRKTALVFWLIVLPVIFYFIIKLGEKNDQG